MALIDEDGNLFGVVNVIDALVIVLVLAVLVAGITVLVDDAEPETRYATIELGGQPDYVVDRLEEGDVATYPNSDDEITVRDVYVTPPADGTNESQPYVTVRAEVDGEVSEDGRGREAFHLAGDPLLPGDEVSLDTGSYVAGGDVTDVGLEEASLSTRETTVLLESTVSDTTANEIEAGDTVDIGPHTVGTITSVQLYPIGDDQQRVLVGAELVALQDGTAPTFAGDPITIDRRLLLQTDSYDLAADVIRRGDDAEPGETETTEVELEVRNVDPTIAGGLEEGMTETVRNETLATITNVTDEPASVVLESEDGDIHEREHPRNRDVTLTVELRTRDTDTGLRFQGERLREGTEVVLDLETVIVEGNVSRIR